MARTNYCFNPSFEVDAASGWNGLTRVTTQSYVGTAAAQGTLSTGVLLFAYAFSGNSKTAQSVAVGAGEVWTISLYMKAVSLATISAGIRAIYMNSSGSFFSDTGNVLNTTINNTGWTRVSATVTVPAGAYWMGFAPVGTGDVYLDAVLIEKSATADTYFDGSSGGSWNSTPNASISYDYQSSSQNAAATVILNSGIDPNSASPNAAELVALNQGVAFPASVGNAAETVIENSVESYGTNVTPGRPAVMGVYDSGIVTTANPTVNFTGTLQAGDVLILSVFSGGNVDPGATVSGLGATWTQIPGANSYLYSFWMGTGATGTGTITVTSAAYTNGRAVRVHHLTNVKPFAVMQQPLSGFPMRMNNNQVVIGYGYSTSTTSQFNLSTRSPGWGWIDQNPMIFATPGNSANSTFLTTAGALDSYVPGASAGMMLVVGSPTGMPVKGQQLLYNGSFESNTNGWTGTNASITASTDYSVYGSRSCKVTANAAAPRVDRFSSVYPSPFVVPGRTYTASAYVKGPAVLNKNVRVNIRWAGTGGSMTSTTNGTATQITNSNVWYSVSCSAVAPAGAYVGGMSVELTDGVSGDIFYVEGCRFEEGAAGSDSWGYFDESQQFNYASTTTLVDWPSYGYYSLATDTPPTPAPTVVGVYLGTPASSNAPTVAVTNSISKGDVLILSDTRASVSTTDITGVSGCGATWTKIGGGNSYMTYWLGTGATAAGTVTATAADSSERSIRVHHLRGVSSDVYIQHTGLTSFPGVVTTANQITIASGLNQSLTGAAISPVGARWTTDAETTYSSNRKHGTATYIAKWTETVDASAAAYGNLLVVGSPLAGFTVGRRNLMGNASYETNNSNWLTQGTTLSSRVQGSATYGVWSLSANQNNSTYGRVYRSYGGNSALGAVTPGRTYTISCWLRCNNDRTGGVVPQWLGVNMGYGTSGTYGTLTALPANTWTRVSWTGVAPAGYYYIGGEATIQNTVAGDVLQWDGWLIEESPTVGEYFDGSSDTFSASQLNYYYGASDNYQSMQVTAIPSGTGIHLKHYESGAFVARTATAKVYVNGVWVVKPPQRWNGTAWVPIT